MQDRGRLHTITRILKFVDKDGQVYRLSRSGTPTKELAYRFSDRLVERKVAEGNILLLEGIEFIYKAITGAGGLTYFDSSNAHLGVGDGTDDEDITQTGLTGSNKYYKRVDDGYPKIYVRKLCGDTAEGYKCTIENRLLFRATFGPDEANFTWNEWTVANGSSDDAVNLNRRKEFLGTKESGMTWVIEVEISIS